MTPQEPFESGVRLFRVCCAPTSGEGACGSSLRVTVVIAEVLWPHTSEPVGFAKALSPEICSSGLFAGSLASTRSTSPSSTPLSITRLMFSKVERFGLSDLLFSKVERIDPAEHLSP